MSGDTARRAGSLLLNLAALGEMAVGVLVAAFPSIGTALIGAPLDSSGLLVMRMLGMAIFVIGLTWWLARGDANRVARHALGFIVYNIGIGVLFALAAMSASQPLIPWIVAIVHLAAGATFAAVVAITPSSTAATKG